MRTCVATPTMRTHVATLTMITCVATPTMRTRVATLTMRTCVATLTRVATLQLRTNPPTPVQVDRAVYQVNQICEKAISKESRFGPGTIITELNIPANKCGLVIGKGGSLL